MIEAFIGMAGIILGIGITKGFEIYQEKTRDKYKQKVYLRERYEELSTLFLNTFDNSIKFFNCKSIHDLEAVALQKDGNKMHLIALLYFPELKNATGLYIESFANLCSITGKHYQPDDKRRTGEQLREHKGYMQTLAEFQTAKDILQEQIEKNAQTYAR